MKVVILASHKCTSLKFTVNVPCLKYGIRKSFKGKLRLYSKADLRLYFSSSSSPPLPLHPPSSSPSSSSSPSTPSSAALFFVSFVLLNYPFPFIHSFIHSFYWFALSNIIYVYYNFQFKLCITSLLTCIVRCKRPYLHSYHDHFEQEICFRENFSRPNFQHRLPWRKYFFQLLQANVLVSWRQKFAIRLPSFVALQRMFQLCSRK